MNNPPPCKSSKRQINLRHLRTRQKVRTDQPANLMMAINRRKPGLPAQCHRARMGKAAHTGKLVKNLAGKGRLVRTKQKATRAAAKVKE